MLQRVPPATDLPDELRRLTHDAHMRLEDGLGLLRPPLSRERFVRTLSRFHGFHAAWEPAMAARPDIGPLFAGRDRLPALDRDLLALGLSPGEIDVLPLCAEAAGLGETQERALGSLYVMEGSTLGGAVIARALTDAPWAPPGGLTYFQGHGSHTGALWRDLKAQLRDHPAASAPGVVAGALETFELLRRWATSAA